MSGLKILACGVAAVLAGSAANATAFDYNFKSNTTLGNYNYVQAGGGSALSFTDTTAGSTLGLQVFGGHINDAKTSSGLNTVSVASVTDYRNYGLGVGFGNDNTQDETHQIDNAGDGTDFVALVFDKSVTLSSFGITAYAMGYNNFIDYDLSYVAYTGTLADLVNGVNVSTFTNVNVNGSSWNQYQNPVSSVSNTIATNSAKTSNIWLVGTALGSPDSRMDGFKITSLSVASAPAAVPEPATWAMMLVGFGAIGGTLRSRRGRTKINAVIGG